jgi:hypothetical protein
LLWGNGLRIEKSRKMGKPLAKAAILLPETFVFLQKWLVLEVAFLQVAAKEALGMAAKRQKSAKYKG